MFLHISVILSTGGGGGKGWSASGGILGSLHRGGGCIQGGVCIQRGLHPGGWADHSPEIHGLLQDTVNKRTICILLECFLVHSFWLKCLYLYVLTQFNRWLPQQQNEINKIDLYNYSIFVSVILMSNAFFLSQRKRTICFCLFFAFRKVVHD